MGLQLRSIDMPRGQLWLRQGIRTFLRRPLGFVSLFLAFLLLIVVLGVIPWVGSVLAASTVPLGSPGAGEAEEGVEGSAFTEWEESRRCVQWPGESRE